MSTLAFTCMLPVCATDDPDHFQAALASITAATLTPDEILICEDGPLPAALARLAAAPGLRRVVNPGPRGLQHNLNHALARVRTPWTCRVDADDLNLANRFERQMAWLEVHPEIDVLGTSIIEFWPDGRERLKAMPTSHAEIVRWARYRNPINHMTACMRTAAVLACGGYPDIPLKEDYGLWLTMIGRGYRLANLEETLVRARLGADFYLRRSGPRHLRAEYDLFRLKRSIPQIGGMAAAMGLIARAAVLATRPSARVVYEMRLRR